LINATSLVPILCSDSKPVKTIFLDQKCLQNSFLPACNFWPMQKIL